MRTDLVSPSAESAVVVVRGNQVKSWFLPGLEILLFRQQPARMRAAAR